MAAIACGAQQQSAIAVAPAPETANGHQYKVFHADGAAVKFVTKRPSKEDKTITLCVPAAFTDAYQHIDGLAISDGKRVNANIDRQLGGACVIIDGDSEVFPTNRGALLTEGLIKSVENAKGSLFQQFQLVKDGVPEGFRDKTLFPRRAWVAFRNGQNALVESEQALTLSQFAKDLADLDVLNAIYTDMGDWDEGWYRDYENKINVLGKARKATDKQTSWLILMEPAPNAQRASNNFPARAWLQKHWAPPAVLPGEPPLAEWSRAIIYSRFPLPRLSSGFRLIPMFRGSYKNKSEGINATINKIACGVIDGRPGAVAFTGWSTGGSGYWEVLTLYRIKAGRIQAVGQRSLEDRALVNKLTVKDNAVVLDWNKHGPMDPASDATIHEVVKLHSKDFEPIVLR